MATKYSNKESSTKALEKIAANRKKYLKDAKSSAAGTYTNPVDELEADLYEDIAEYYGEYEDVGYENLKSKLKRASKKRDRDARATEKSSSKGLRNYRKGGLVTKANCGASMRPTQKGTKGIK